MLQVIALFFVRMGEKEGIATNHFCSSVRCTATSPPLWLLPLYRSARAVGAQGRQEQWRAASPLLLRSRLPHRTPLVSLPFTPPLTSLTVEVQGEVPCKAAPRGARGGMLP